MSALPFDASRYAPKPTPAGPLAKPSDLPPVVRKKAERQGLSRVGPKHAAKKAKQFGEQAARCRAAPCCCCGHVGEDVEPHHWPTRANGGLDADTCALCSDCHSFFHDVAGSPEKFLELMGCDVLAEIEKMRRGARPARRADHECVPVLREREFDRGRFVLESRYVCVNASCRHVFTDAELEGYQP